MRLKDRVAIVVGSGQSPGEGMGNGRATALTFAREGAKVLCVDHNLGSAEETVGMIRQSKGFAEAFKADVTLPAIGEELKKRYPTVKIVMYDALPIAPLPDTGAPGKEALALQAAMKAKGCDAIIAGNGG